MGPKSADRPIQGFELSLSYSQFQFIVLHPDVVADNNALSMNSVYIMTNYGSK